jgi:hypothetical protein
LAWSVLVTLTGALPSPVFAQQASGIAGVVTDPSGALLPGVTVEAASPALIEKVRSAITGGDGRYNIVDLRPGTYTVSFTLAGFNTLRREGIVLPAGFTATVNAEMGVGALEETITVTGASPLVDTQSVRQDVVLPSGLLQTLPFGVMGISTLNKVVPGLKPGGADVGASDGLYVSNANVGDTFHGKTGVKLTYDGMQITNLSGTGSNTNYAVNFATVLEVSVETGGASAESDANNYRVNLVPKEGGNIYTFETSAVFSGRNLQSDNLSDDLRARGVTNLNKVLNLSDLNVTLGGPIKQNRLWFFSASRLARVKNQVQGIYFNATRGTPFYTPDLEEPAYRDSRIRSQAGRLTWQAAPKHKVSGFVDVQAFEVWGIGDNNAMEAQTRWSFWPEALLQGSWSSPLTSRLLLEAGASMVSQPFYQDRLNTTDNLGFVVGPDDVAIRELSTGFVYNAKFSYNQQSKIVRNVERFAVSYVTGSHAFKTGFQLQQARNVTDTAANRDVGYSFLNGVTNTITQFATPYSVDNRVKADLGIFVQDRWTLNRLALNMGLRVDYFNGYVPAQHLPATPSGWIPERNFAPVTRVPEWTDVNPRVGASYDLFGNSRTALKASLGRYVGQQNATVGAANNPISTSVTSVTRQWNDINRDYVPDCDLSNFNDNGECGPISDQNFGKNNPLATRYADDIIRGFGIRDNLWDFIAEVQHQIGSRVSVTAGYNRHWSDNPTGTGFNNGVTDNLLVTPVDYSPYCIRAPLDSRLPGGGGYEICGLYDVSVAKFGQVQNLVTSEKNFGGKKTRVSDFVDASLESRLGSGVVLGGSVTTGRTVNDTCFVVDSPQQLLNCHVVTPFKATTLVKAHASYPFPGDFVANAVFQNVSGISYNADYPAPNAAIAPSLGRNLAACGTRPVCTLTAVVPLVPPQTLFEPRRTQLDLRVSKLFRVRSKWRLRADLDAYNVLNSSAVLSLNNTYGPAWLRPVGSGAVGAGFVNGRLFELRGLLMW